MLIMTGIVLLAVSGIPALLNVGRASARLARLSMWIIVAGAIVGLIGCAIDGGDPLSAFFAAPVFLLAGAGGLYAERYWPAAKRRGGYVRFFFGLTTGALALVMTATNTILFLAAWEIVAGASFFLVATEDQQADTRRAAWTYLAASHVSALALFAVIAMLHTFTGAWSFAALPAGFAASAAGRALFCLALFGFGVKAGLMPFHVWLPGAHASGPSHVSAVMSGVVIKMGIYGLIRVLSLYDAIPTAFGATVLIFGIVSSILGVAFALAQHDLKRLLAYHSIENIGIIATGLGVGLLGQAQHQPLLAVLGYAGALLHVWNHGLFKALLFLSGGAAIHETHTREIDRMGGLAQRMPFTGAAFLIGAAAIAGLPPLNGFVSEWLLYVGGFRAITLPNPPLLVVLVVPALALTGALALACFVKAYGAVFLGSPRSEEAAAAHEAPASMRVAMAPLVLGCVAIGLLPTIVAPALRSALTVILSRPSSLTLLRASSSGEGLHHAQWTRSLGVFAPQDDVLAHIQIAALVIAAIIAIVFLALRLATRAARRTVTWDCGYAAPTARMQYTSSSFARGLVAFFAWAMPPVVHAPKPFPLFPQRAAFESHVPDTVLDRALMPALRRAKRGLAVARRIQSGRVQLYLLYVAATLIALLAWSAL